MNTAPGENFAEELLTAGALTVPARQEVTFADGTVIWLHPFHVRGRAQVWGRLMPMPGGTSHYLDLARVAPELRYELPTQNCRDTASAVFHSLRKHFSCAAAFRQAIGANAS